MFVFSGTSLFVTFEPDSGTTTLDSTAASCESVKGAKMTQGSSHTRHIDIRFNVMV
jgi:hypothetical protein